LSPPALDFHPSALGATRGIEIGFGFRPVYEVTDADAELGLLDVWKLKRVAAEVILAL
jgi:hypothetical protein